MIEMDMVVLLPCVSTQDLIRRDCITEQTLNEGGQIHTLHTINILGIYVLLRYNRHICI